MKLFFRENMRVIKLFIILILMSAVFLFVPEASSIIKPYYSGEAINYNGRVVFGTVNAGALEIFELTEGRIYKKNIIKSDEIEYQEFFDLLFNKELGSLYVYAINGRYLYKYDITDITSLKLVRKIKDNSWDYFYGLTKTSGRIATVGTKGVKIWNKDLQVVNSYNIHSTFAKNIKISQNENYIFRILQDSFQIIDGFYRDIVLEKGINIKDDHIRNLYNDPIGGAIYIVDDSSLKKIQFNGQSEQFNHISSLGYDADGISGRDYVYFSDGIGVVKIRKADMQPVDWLFTSQLGPGNGWAMGLRVVPDQSGEAIIVFNGSNILALDENFDLIDYYEAQEYDYSYERVLSLSADKYRGAPYTRVSLRGKGFGPKEEVEIQFGKEKWHTTSDQGGDFTAIIMVPDVSFGMIDIKADGLVSGLTYSVAFAVD